MRTVYVVRTAMIADSSPWAGVAVFLVHCLVGLIKLEFLSVFGPRTRKTRFFGLGRTKKASCFGPSVVFLVLYTDRFCRTKKASKKLVFFGPASQGEVMGFERAK